MLYACCNGGHNSVASLVHRALCDHFGTSTCNKPWPQPITLANRVKILWDFDICTDYAHWPAIVILNNDCRTRILIDLTIPADANKD